jgi:hypothetical protein
MDQGLIANDKKSGGINFDEKLIVANAQLAIYPITTNSTFFRRTSSLLLKHQNKYPGYA